MVYKKMNMVDECLILRGGSLLVSGPLNYFPGKKKYAFSPL